MSKDVVTVESEKMSEETETMSESESGETENISDEVVKISDKDEKMSDDSESNGTEELSDEVNSDDTKQVSEVEFLKSQFLNLMECPVCLEIPRRGPIYGCKNGHMLCNNCKPKVVECPTCREKETTCRNLVAEKMLEKAIQNYPLKCKYSTQYGCTVKGLLSEIEYHEIYDCEYRTVLCPKIKKCDWKGPLTQLIEHINQEECASILNLQSSDSFFVASILARTGEEKPAFEVAVGDLTWDPFLLKAQNSFNNFYVLKVCRDSPGNWKAYVKSISKVKNTMRVEMCAQNPLRKRDNFTYNGDVASSEDSEKEIIQKGNYLMLRDDQVKKLVGEDLILEFSIRIFQEHDEMNES